MKEIGYTEIINKLMAYIENKGFNVILFSDKISEDVAGRIYYIEKEIHLGFDLSSEEAMYTLIHEGGHMLSFIRLFEEQGLGQPPSEKREFFALQYGWKIIKDLNLPITKEMWRENCH